MPKIQVRSHEPISFDPAYKQGWADAWLRFKSKPGRKVFQFGPTLLTKPDLEFDLKMDLELQEKHRDNPELDWSGDIKRHQEILAHLDDPSAIFVEPDSSRDNRGCPSIYTAKSWIDRAEAERMLTEFLKLLNLPRKFTFKWIPAKCVVIPMSFGERGEP